MFQHSPQQPPKFGPKPTMAPSTQATNTDSADDKLFRQPITFDGKRMRKAVMRKTVDYNSSVVKQIENRKWFKDLGKRNGMQPDDSFSSDVYPPACMIDNPINAVTTKFVRTSTNKLRCPIFCVAWTPEGRRLVTGASSGEFTLWNGLTFNFETILQAHDSPVRSMVWSHADNWLLSSDHGGFIKYWQSNMNNVQMYEAHKEPIRGLSFSPTDNKFASCSDDGFVKIWDFYRCAEERILKGHGADVKCVDWHPTKSLVVSGSKDSQQPIKLWDPRTGTGLTTLHAHKSTVMQIKWNQNGNWLLTASRDHLLKLFDIRMMKEMQTFRGHKREATAISWHPIHESLFVSGGSDGAIMFWVAGAEKDVGNMDMAHEGMVWSLAWHPLGHILCSGSNDHSSKFWTRNRLGDKMRDKYNLNILDTEDDADGDHPGVVMTAIPGMDTALNPAEDFPDIDRYDLGEKGPGLGVGSSPANRSSPPRPRPSEPLQNPGFNLPNIKASPQIPGLGSLDVVTSGNEPGNSALRPDAPPFEPGRFGERNHNGPFEPPQPQRFPRPDNFRLEPGRRDEPPEQGRRHFDGPTGEHSTLPPAPPRNDFGRDQWNEPRGPPGDFKRPNWHEQGPKDFERRDRSDDHRPPGPDFRGPPGDRFFGPLSERMGLLGSPPRNPDADARPGLLGPPPVQQPPQHLGPGLQGVPSARPSLLGAPPANDFPPHGSVPNNNSGGEPRHDQGPWRPPNERDMERSNLSPRFEMGDPHTRHPNDLSSRGFRRGTSRGHHRGHNSPSSHDLDQAEPKTPYTHPFLNKLGSRGFKGGVAQGQHGMHSENRDPRRAAHIDESQQGRGPEDPRGPRFGGWGSSQEDMNWGQSPGHDTRGQQRDEPRDPRMMRGPLGPPGQEQNSSMSEAAKGANDTKPAIRPLMSISPPPMPIGHSSFDFDLGDSWKGAPDRRGRKRSGEQEGFREADREKAPDRGPPKSMRQEEDWRRGPDQGPPPEGWRGPRGGDPDERFKEEFPRGEFGAASEGEGGPRGRGKPRGGRRGRGGRR